MKNILTVIFGRAVGKSTEQPLQLVVLKHDIGYDFEIREDNKMLMSLRFLYGQKVHKAAYCLSGAVYGFFNNDELAEAVIKVIDDKKDLLGGYELTR